MMMVLGKVEVILLDHASDSSAAWELSEVIASWRVFRRCGHVCMEKKQKLKIPSPRIPHSRLGKAHVIPPVISPVGRAPAFLGCLGNTLPVGVVAPPPAPSRRAAGRPLPSLTPGNCLVFQARNSRQSTPLHLAIAVTTTTSQPQPPPPPPKPSRTDSDPCVLAISALPDEYLRPSLLHAL